MTVDLLADPNAAGVDGGSEACAKLERIAARAAQELSRRTLEPASERALGAPVAGSRRDRPVHGRPGTRWRTR